MLAQIPALLADMAANDHSELMSNLRVVLDVVGAIGIVLIVILLIAALPMIPDFIRYMRLKNM
jgi:hypothetical protein